MTERDGRARRLAIAMLTIVYTLKRGDDLCDKFTLKIADPQLDRQLAFIQESPKEDLSDDLTSPVRSIKSLMALA